MLTVKIRLLALSIGLIASAMLGGTSADAAQIKFEHTGSAASGTLDGVAFGPTSFVITALGDTSARTSFGSGYYIDHSTAAIEISVVGRVDFISATRTFVNNGLSVVGFSRSSGSDLYNGPINPAFSSWDMLSSIGTIAGSANILQWISGDIDTTGGILNMDTAQTSGSFTATVGEVPLPAAAPLLVGALVGLAAMRRRRAGTV